MGWEVRTCARALPGELLQIAKWESEVESGKWMAGVSGTQLSEGPRAMVKDISELVCVCVHSHIRQSELFLNFRAFRRSLASRIHFPSM